MFVCFFFHPHSCDLRIHPMKTYKCQLIIEDRFNDAYLPTMTVKMSDAPVLVLGPIGLVHEGIGIRFPSTEKWRRPPRGLSISRKRSLVIGPEYRLCHRLKLHIYVLLRSIQNNRFACCAPSLENCLSGGTNAQSSEGGGNRTRCTPAPVWFVRTCLSARPSDSMAWTR